MLNTEDKSKVGLVHRTSRSPMRPGIFSEHSNDNPESTHSARPVHHSTLLTPHSAERRRGSILVAVLAIILLLSFLITRFMEEAVEDLEYRSIFNEPTDVRAFAYSMLEVTLATVHEVALIDDGKLHAPEQGWSNPIAYAGIKIPNDWDVQITITDEGGKLPLNTMSEELLNRLLEDQLDMDFGTARELSSSLLDWIDADNGRRLNGAESEEYLSRNPGYKAANGPLQTLEELRYLQTWEDEFFDENGRPNELFEQLSGLVSVINSGPVNINAAPSEVLETLALEEGFQDEALFDGLDEPYLTSTPDSVNSQTGGVEVGLLRIMIRVNRGNAPFILTALVEPNFEEDTSAAASAPGSATDNDKPKTGATSEQDAIQYPFKLLLISEYTKENSTTKPARYSAMDIGEEADSF
ncbi:MAG: general secretion pathway protein GspK [Opitutales bacterium]|jgi:type II secretory pathway component PulK|nr:general secretion pathway protein GspK [Opitutales bacterium]MDP4694561.1 general secretion pathway protein GspK [Opitutales bacterium]